MAIERITAPTLADAIADVRARYGTAATIVSWKNVGGAIALDVNVEGGGAQSAKAAASKSDHVEDEYRAWNDTIKSKSRAPRHDVFKADGPEDRAAPPRQNGMADILAKSSAAHIVQEMANAASAPKRAAAPNQHRANGPKIAGKKPPAPSALAKHLVSMGADVRHLVPLTIMRQSGLSLAATPDSKEIIAEKMAQYLSGQLDFDPVEIHTRTPIMIVGGPGSGKTLAIAKLAARAISAGGSVVAIGTDDSRMGARAQLHGLCEGLGAHCLMAESADDLGRKAAAARQEGHIVFIDTPAFSPLDDSDGRLAVRLASAADADMIACLPADGRPDDLAEQLAAWGALGVEKIIATRMDLTGKAAGLIAAIAHVKPREDTNFNLAHLSVSPFVAGGMSLAGPENLLPLLGLSGGNFNQMRSN